MKFAVLTTFNSPLNIPFIEECRARGILPAAILVDSFLSEKSVEIVRQRMVPDFKWLDLSQVNLTDIPTHFVTNHNNPATLEFIRSSNIDYLVSCGTPRILKEGVLNATRGIVNCHPGILPKYRGCTAVEWSIYNGDPVGATSHFMVKGIDEGPIIATKTLTVTPRTTYRQIRTAMNQHQAKMLASALIRVGAENLDVHNTPPQAEGSYFKPIPDEYMATVYEKTESGEYHSPWS